MKTTGCTSATRSSRVSPTSFPRRVAGAPSGPRSGAVAFASSGPADSFELLAQPILPLSSAPADPRFEILLRMRATDGTRLGLEKLASGAACQDLTRGIDRRVIEQTIERLAASRHLLRDHPAKF